MTNSVIKIDLNQNTYIDNGIHKLKITNPPLTGIYEDKYGTIHYYKNGKWHNENGPAYITKTGYKMHFIDGKLHKIDGPAVILPNGNYAWYINGYRINNEVMDIWLEENDIPLDWNIWSVSDKMLFALHWSDYNG